MKNISHIKFCEEYLTNGHNATKAYALAFPNCQYENATSNGARLLQQKDVAEYIKNKKNELALESKITREYILNEYLELMESCKTEGLYGDGKLKDRANWNKALQQISKLLGLDASEKIDITSGGFPIIFNYKKPIEIEHNIIEEIEDADFKEIEDNFLEQGEDNGGN